MRRHRRARITIATLSLLSLLLVATVSAYGLRARAADNSQAQDGKPDQQVVTTYFQILNAGLRTGDFSAMATVYAPDATLVQSNSKNVVVIKHGVSDIIAWYTATFGVNSPAHGMQFVFDPRHPPMRSLAPHVVITYEYATPPGFSQGGYCMHVFTLQGGMLESVDWATYFGPVK